MLLLSLFYSHPNNNNNNNNNNYFHSFFSLVILSFLLYSIFPPSGIFLDAGSGDGGSINGKRVPGTVSTVAGLTNITTSERILNMDLPLAMGLLTFPYAMHFDTVGNLYIADGGTIWLADANTQRIRKLAGDPAGDADNENIPGTSAYIQDARGITGDTAGNIYYSDGARNRIFKYNTTTGLVNTVLGNAWGDAIRGCVSFDLSSTSICGARGIFYYNPLNMLYIACPDKHQILAFNFATVCNVLGVPGVSGFGGNGDPLTINLHTPIDVFVSMIGTQLTLLSLESVGGVVRNVTLGSDGFLDGNSNSSIIVGIPGATTSSGDGGSPTSAAMHNPICFGVDINGYLYIAESDHIIRRVAKSIDEIDTLYNGDEAVDKMVVSNISLFQSYLGDITSCTLDNNNDLILSTRYVDIDGTFIWKIANPKGNNPYTHALVGYVGGVTLPAQYVPFRDGNSLGYAPSMWGDQENNLFYCDAFIPAVHRIDMNSDMISYYAGTRTGTNAPYNGGDITASLSKLHHPTSIVGDSLGNLYMSDGINGIRKVVKSSGMLVSVIRETNVDCEGAYDVSSTLCGITALAYDIVNNKLYIAQKTLIRSFAIDSQNLTIVSGAADEGSSNSDLMGSRFTSIVDIWAAPNNNLYVADTVLIRYLDFQKDTVSISAGDGPSTSDGALATSFSFDSAIHTVCGDSYGNIYVANENPTLRMVDYITRKIFAVLGDEHYPTQVPGEYVSNNQRIYPVSKCYVDSRLGDVYYIEATTEAFARVRKYWGLGLSVQPANEPTSQPTSQPSCQPTNQPTSQPSGHPSAQPTSQPSGHPSGQPTSQPSGQPSGQPSDQPTSRPSGHPSGQPTSQPSGQPSGQPTSQPSGQPSDQPTSQPSGQPSDQPTSQPSGYPSGQPTSQPSGQPSGQPTSQPSGQPSDQPTSQPSDQPTSQPSGHPSGQPTSQPSGHPSGQPTSQPSGQPSGQPSDQPSDQPTSQHSGQPSDQPTSQPSGHPSGQPSDQPSGQPSGQPSDQPTSQPSGHLSGQPTSQPSGQPSCQPINQPTSQSSVHPSGQPTNRPTSQVSSEPSGQPISSHPSGQPTSQPTSQPSSRPSGQASSHPSVDDHVSCEPSNRPSGQPSSQPSNRPTDRSSGQPTGQSSQKSSDWPSSQPSGQPNSKPSVHSNDEPSTGRPSFQPSIGPTQCPTSSGQPSSVPSCQPSGQPSGEPSGQPSTQPSGQPSNQPSSQPSSHPTLFSSRLFLTSAVFSSNGLEVTVTLSASTNRMGMSVSITTDLVTFPCAQVLAFEEVEDYRCVWANASQILIRDTTKTSLIVGSKIRLALPSTTSTTTSGGSSGSSGSTTMLKIVCSATNATTTTTTSTTRCPQTVIDSSSYVLLSSPVSPILPIIGVFTSSTIRNCSAWKLDLSTTTVTSGNAGRPWMNASFMVEGLVYMSNTSAITRELTRQFSSSSSASLLVIPHGLLHEDESYRVRVTLCNFLLACGSKEVVTTVISSNSTSTSTSTSTSLPGTVRIVGSSGSSSSLQHVFAYDSLTLLADVSIMPCEGPTTTLTTTSTTTSRLSYLWQIKLLSSSSSSSWLSSLTSQSKDERKFLLPAYSLTVGSSYLVLLTVRDRLLPSLSSSANVTIFVQPADLVAAIIPSALQQQVRLQTGSGGSGSQGSGQGSAGGLLVLNASTSYDPNTAARGSGSQLSYRWTCQSYSSIGERLPSCSVTMTGQQGVEEGVVTSPTVRITATNATALGSLSTITLTVSTSLPGSGGSGSTSSNTSSNSVQVRVIASAAPLLTHILPTTTTLTTTSSSSSIPYANIDRALTLYSTILSPLYPCNATWSMTREEGSSTTSTTTLPPLVEDYPRTVVVNRLTNVNLRLPSYSLLGDYYYTFTLSCTLLIGSGQGSGSGSRRLDTATTTSSSSYLTVTVSTNSPPRPGQLTVYPLSGYTLLTSFTILTDLWTDADLPLAYTFTFLSSVAGGAGGGGGGCYLPLKTKSLVNQMVGILASANGLNHSTNVSVTTEDVYQATGNRLERVVAVYPPPAATTTTTPSSSSTPSPLITAAQNLLSQQAEMTVDELQNVISVVTSIVNVVDCSALPTPCAALHRTPCSATTNTCGSCLSGYLSTGRDGDDNSPCLTVADLTAGSGSGSGSGAQCTPSSSSCVPWQECNSTTYHCVDRSKTCTSAMTCSSHGSCHYQSTSSSSSSSSSTTTYLTTCSMIATSCDTVCTCATGYTGRDCHLTVQQMEQEQEVRSQLLAGLTTVVAAGGGGGSELVNAATSLSSIVRDQYDLSVTSTSQVAQVAQDIIQQAIAAAAGGGGGGGVALNLSTILGPIDSALSTLITSTSNTTSLLSSSLKNVSTVLFSYQDLLLREGQSYAVAKDTFRLSTLVLDNVGGGGGGGSTIEVALPLTQQEQIEKLLTSSSSSSSLPSIRVGANGSALYVSVVVMDRQVYYPSSSSSTTSTSYPTSDIIAVRSKGVDYIDITLSSSTTTSTTTSKAIRYSITCPAYLVMTKNFTCPDSGRVMVARCNGTAGVYNGSCPVLVSSCASLGILSTSTSGTSSIGGGGSAGKETCYLLNTTRPSTSSTSTSTSAYYLTCRCVVADSSVDSRVVAGVVLEYVGSDIATTFSATTSAFTSAALVGKTYIILSLYTSLWCSALLAIAYYSYRWKKKEKEQEEEEKEKGSKGSSGQQGSVQGSGEQGSGQQGSVSKEVQYSERRKSMITLLQQQQQQGSGGGGGGEEGSSAATPITTTTSSTTSPPLLLQQQLAYYLTTIFPAVFETQSWVEGWRHELAAHHAYYTFFFYLSSSSSPLVDILKMTTLQSFTLFLLALLYDLNYPDDDGSCAHYHTMGSCLERKYKMDATRSYCHWQGEGVGEEEEGVCSYASPSFSLTTSMYIAMVISVATCLIADPLEEVMTWLATPDNSSYTSKEVGRGSGRGSGSGGGGVVAVAVEEEEEVSMTTPAAHGVAAATTTNTSSSSSYYYPLKKNKVYPSSTSSYHAVVPNPPPPPAPAPATSSLRGSRRKVEEQEEEEGRVRKVFERLKQDIINQRSALLLLPSSSSSCYCDDSVVTAFDRAWCWDASREDFITLPPPPPTATTTWSWLWGRGSSGSGRRRRRRGRRVDGSFSVGDVIFQELVEVARERDYHYHHLLLLPPSTSTSTSTHGSSSETERGYELIHLFVIDLLGRTTPAARIFYLKTKDDFPATTTTTTTATTSNTTSTTTTTSSSLWTRKKVALIVFVLSLNLFFLYYTMLKGYSKGLSWQVDYLQAWVVQLALDVFLFETILCSWLHLVIPWMVAKEVHAVYQLLLDCVGRIGSAQGSGARGSGSAQGSGGSGTRGSGGGGTQRGARGSGGRGSGSNGYILNATQYFFISTQLAQYYPDLMESALILSYATHLPGERARLWQKKLLPLLPTPPPPTDQHYLGSAPPPPPPPPTRISLTRPTSWLLSLIKQVEATFSYSMLYLGAYLPRPVQRVIIRVMEPMIVSALTLIFYLFYHQPVYLAGVLGGMVVIGGLVWWDYYRMRRSMTESGSGSSEGGGGGGGGGGGVLPILPDPALPVVVEEEEEEEGSSLEELHKAATTATYTSGSHPHLLLLPSARMRLDSNDSSFDEKNSLSIHPATPPPPAAAVTTTATDVGRGGSHRSSSSSTSIDSLRGGRRQQEEEMKGNATSSSCSSSSSSSCSSDYDYQSDDDDHYLAPPIALLEASRRGTSTHYLLKEEEEEEEGSASDNSSGLPSALCSPVISRSPSLRLPPTSTSTSNTTSNATTTSDPLQGVKKK